MAQQTQTQGGARQKRQAPSQGAGTQAPSLGAGTPLGAFNPDTPEQTEAVIRLRFHFN